MCSIFRFPVLLLSLGVFIFSAEFIYSNEKYFHGSRIVELGAGVNGVPGITAAAAGASFVIFTENSENQQVCWLQLYFVALAVFNQ